MTMIETNRLIIREFIPNDARLLLEYSQEDCAKQELPDEVLESLAQAEKMIESYKKSYVSKEYPLVYAISNRDPDLLIGHISLSPIDDGIEVGYAIASDFQGKGYAKEAVSAFAAWAKKELNLSKLYGYAKASNRSSWKVLEGSGFILFDERVRHFFGGTYLTKHYYF